MKCPFCDKEIDSVEQAIELDWHPDFWAGEENYQGPVCPECCSTYLVTDEDGNLSSNPVLRCPRRRFRLPRSSQKPTFTTGRSFRLARSSPLPTYFGLSKTLGKRPISSWIGMCRAIGAKSILSMVGPMMRLSRAATAFYLPIERSEG